MKFEWHRTSAGDGACMCEWGGLILWATETGEWRVNRMHSTASVAMILVSSEYQRSGDGLEEAKLMAQGAAMCVVLKNS